MRLVFRLKKTLMSESKNPIISTKLVVTFVNNTLHMVQTTEVDLITKADSLNAVADLYRKENIEKETFDKLAEQIRTSDMPDGDLTPSIHACARSHFHVVTFYGQHTSVFSYQEFDRFCAWALDNNLIIEDEVEPLKATVAELYPEFPAETPDNLKKANIGDIISQMAEEMGMRIEIMEIQTHGGAGL